MWSSGTRQDPESFTGECERLYSKEIESTGGDLQVGLTAVSQIHE